MVSSDQPSSFLCASARSVLLSSCLVRPRRLAACQSHAAHSFRSTSALYSTQHALEPFSSHMAQRPLVQPCPSASLPCPSASLPCGSARMCSRPRARRVRFFSLTQHSILCFSNLLFLTLWNGVIRSAIQLLMCKRQECAVIVVFGEASPPSSLSKPRCPFFQIDFGLV